MSYQLKNVLVLKDKKYQIIKSTNKGLIKPEHFGIKARYLSSTLMRGYKTIYEVKSNLHLILIGLYVNVHMNEGIKLIKGIPPSMGSRTNIDSQTTFREYRNLNFRVEYSGFILIGYGVISGLETKYHLHGVNYEEVIELKVEKGKITLINDLSEKMREHRTSFQDGDYKPESQKLQYDNEIEKWGYGNIEL